MADAEASDRPRPGPATAPNGGEVARLIAASDWSNSPLGPWASWPQTLKTIVGLILPAASQIVLFWGEEFVALYNDAYAPSIGDKHPRALGRPARENWSELWSDLEPLLQRVFRTGETIEAKDRPFYIERHGYPEIVYFDISYSAVPDESGGIGGVLCIVAETTERVLGEQALRESEERLRLAVDNAEIGFWDVQDGHGDLTWPPRTKAMFGISPDVPVTIEDFYSGLHPDDLQHVADAYAAAADPTQRALYDVEYRTIGKEDGIVRWVAAKGRGIFDGDGADARCLRVIGTAIEITDRKNAEQALTALNETLETRVAEEIERRSKAEEVLRQAQKMETVGQLSGGIAHDFNNLLQIIHGNLSVLDRTLEANVANAKLRRAVANALTGTERAAALTKRLLAFSRRQPLNSRALDVNRLIGDMSEMLQRTLGETVVVATDLAPDLPSALVDGNQLENAILNLAVNARDAMPHGGRLEISTSIAPDGPGSGGSRSERSVRIAVRDNGHGMSEEVRSRAVEPFFSTKEVGQGTGLGLSMVYGFVRQSGGHLALDSREGSGTTVELYLPATQARAVDPEHRHTSEELPTGRGECVLLCEDDKDVRFFSSETLKDLGYAVIEAQDAASALAALKARGRVDLLFTDVVLPGGRTGAELAREARQIQPDLKILFTTGYARSALDHERRTGHGVQILLKPFGVDALAAKVRQMLR